MSTDESIRKAKKHYEKLDRELTILVAIHAERPTPDNAAKLRPASDAVQAAKAAWQEAEQRAKTEAQLGKLWLPLPLPGDPDALWILDLSSWVRGAWESIKPAPPPDDLNDRSVVRVVVQRLAGLLGTERPARLVAAVDSASPPWQAALWPSYKAGRKQPGPGYYEQLRIVRQVLDLHNIPSVEADGYQADDVIATLTKQARAAGLRVVVITKDHDLWQLIGPSVVAWGGGKDDPVIDADAVRERYHGVGPELLADMMALAGDGDEAPGVPRIGDKTAAALLLKRGSLAEVLRKWQWEKGKLSDALRDGAEAARLSRDLVTLRDAPISFELDDATVGWTDHDAWKIRVLGEELGSEVMQVAEAMLPVAELQERRP